MMSRMTMISGNSWRITILIRTLNCYFLAICSVIYQNLLHRRVHTAVSS